MSNQLIDTLIDKVPYGGKKALDRGGLIRAEHYLEYEGLPILENAVVYKTAEQIVVNNIYLSTFADYGLLSRKKLDDSLKGCSRMIWDYQKFKDVYLDDEVCYLPFVDRIQELPKLTYKNIEFSSLMYYYDVEKRKLHYFINTREILFFREKFIIPSIAEVEDDYIIVPLTDNWNFYGLSFKPNTKIYYSEGFLKGVLGTPMYFRVVNHPTLMIIKLKEGEEILIGEDGEFFIEEYSSDVFKKYRVIPCGRKKYLNSFQS